MKVRLGALVLGAFLLSGASAGDAPLRVEMIDVEGGGATLFVTPGGKSVLLDTGWPDEPAEASGSARPASSADRIVAAARRMGVSRIDYLIVTHYHLDHVGGVSDLMARIPVGTVIDHGENRELPSGRERPGQSAEALYARHVQAIPPRPYRLVRPGQTLRVDGLTFTVVAADGDVIRKPLVKGAATPAGCGDFDAAPSEPGENFRSIGLVARFGKTRILSLADATRRVEGKLVCPVNLLGPIDLFIVSHHGSALSNSAALLSAIAPRVALMGNGANKGGDKAVFEALAATPSTPVLWQQHAALRSPEVDRPSDYVANLGDGPDAGHSLRADVWKDGRMQVTNDRHGYFERYEPVYN